MNQPKVSILIPIYNTEKYLRECLDSVISQTLEDIEIICVNDGSTDGSKAILQEYAGKDSRIKHIDKQNGGYGSAMNVGLKHVTGQYIGIVEPDDYISPDMYQRLYQEAEKYRADVVKSNFTNFFDLQNGEKSPKPYINNWFSESRKIPESPFKITECAAFLSFHPSIWSCIYRTGFISKNHIDFQEIKGAGWSDNLFQVKTLVLAEKIAYIDEAFYFYRRRNIDDVKDLKDFTIPFDRTHEIHQWFNENQITNTEILASIAKRELAYLGLVFRGQSEEKLQQMKHYLSRFFKDVDTELLINSGRSTSSERHLIQDLKTRDISEAYAQYKKRIQPSVWRNLQELRKKCLSIHLSGETKRIILFGIRIM